jgi:hypothetical protein
MPSVEAVQASFATLEEGQVVKFYEDYVAEDSTWTITGTENPLGGVYPSKTAVVQAFLKNASYTDGKLQHSDTTLIGIGENAVQQTGVKINNIISAGDTAVVELTTSGITAHGTPTANENCWIVRIYLDSALVKKVWEEKPAG